MSEQDRRRSVSPVGAWRVNPQSPLWSRAVLPAVGVLMASGITWLVTSLVSGASADEALRRDVDRNERSLVQLREDHDEAMDEIRHMGGDLRVIRVQIETVGDLKREMRGVRKALEEQR